MQLPFFYEENIAPNGLMTLSESTSRHVCSVLRMKKGDQLLLTDGKGILSTCSIGMAQSKKTEVTIIDGFLSPRPSPEITIAISPLKNNKRLEWFLEKATEIGVSKIILLQCERTQKVHIKDERLKNILVSAMLQSRQSWLPEINGPEKFSSIISEMNYDQKFIAHCDDEKKTDLTDSFKPRSRSSIILIGPEGDFTSPEIALAIDKGFVPVSLGQTRLRSETAALVAAVLLKILCN